ncbi:unnamed protein product, partial [Ectocarpus sp. 6 AP-2014]
FGTRGLGWSAASRYYSRHPCCRVFLCGFAVTEGLHARRVRPVAEYRARQARQAIFSNSSLPGVGSQMGDVASAFEAIAARYPQEGSPIWPDNFNDRQNRVVRTRREFGLDWRYGNSCPLGNHSNLEITPDQSAALRNATVITIPNGASTTLHEKVRKLSPLARHRICPFRGHPCAPSVQLA